MKQPLNTFLMPLMTLRVILCAAWPTQAQAEPKAGSVVVYTDHVEDNVTFSGDQVTSPYLSDFVRWSFADAGKLPRRDSVLAVGSSSMRMWTTIEKDLAPLDVIPRGFGGSRMRHVVQFQDFFDRYQAGNVLVYQGDNDLAYPSSEVERDFIEPTQAFIKNTRAIRPETEFYFISIKPSPARLAAKERFEAANARLKAMCEEDPKLHFIDVYSPMLGPDGNPDPSLYRADRLHLNEKGYALWKRVVREGMGLAE